MRKTGRRDVIVITFDTDHMTDPMMEVFVRTILANDVACTFFCSQWFPSLTNVQHVELALHPYLANSSEWIAKTIDLRSAVSAGSGRRIAGLRPHSLMCSQKYLVDLDEIGITYVSSISVPVEQEVSPFRYPWGPVEIPIRYMDNMDLWWRDKRGSGRSCFDTATIDLALASSTLFCFDFHPIHIYLNTTRFADYEAWVRDGRPNLEKPIERASYGVRDFYIELCNAIRRSGALHGTCADVATNFAAST